MKTATKKKAEKKPVKFSVKIGKKTFHYRLYTAFPIDDLIVYNQNPRYNENAVDPVANSMKQFGLNNVLSCGPDFRICAGDTRYKSARKLNITHVPILVGEHLVKESFIGYNIADNKTGSIAEFTDDLTAQLSKLIKSTEGDDLFDATGFSSEELDQLIADGEASLNENKKDPDDVPDLPKKAKTKLGDLYILGNHRLLCGDAMDIDSLNKLIDNDKIGMILTDPPYGMNLDTDYSKMKGSLKFIGRGRTRGKKYNAVINDNKDFDPIFLMDQFSHVREQFWFGADYYAELISGRIKGSWIVWDKRKESQSEAFGSEFELIWSKHKHKRRMLRHDWFGFLSSENTKEARNRMHPTQKPTSLLIDILRQWGRNNHIVADFFGGSGSTLIACERINRQCRMIEIDPIYCDVIVKRWRDFTGKKAKLRKAA